MGFLVLDWMESGRAPVQTFAHMTSRRHVVKFRFSVDTIWHIDIGIDTARRLQLNDKKVAVDEVELEATR
jgi:hypothetical protein